MAPPRKVGISPDRHVVDPETGCWNWVGSTDRDGYGRLMRSGRMWFAHRYMWVHHNCRTCRAISAREARNELPTMECPIGGCGKTARPYLMRRHLLRIHGLSVSTADLRTCSEPTEVLAERFRAAVGERVAS